MTERDDHLSEGFLVDGVAPSVIGGEESPEPPLEDDYEDPVRNARRAEPRREPPTTPIPAQNLAQDQVRAYGLPPEQHPEQRKGWLGRMFGGPQQ
jgi:hypothetical protein